MTPQQIFEEGAKAMQSLIVAKLMLAGNQAAALSVMQITDSPRFQMPEQMVIDDQKEHP